MVRSYFDFLLNLGFTVFSTSNPVRYDHPDWYVEIWLGQGDNDVLLGFKKDSQLLPPGSSRLFPLQKVIRTCHSGKFPLLSEFPRKPGVSDNEHFLAYASNHYKKYLPEILKDSKLLGI